MAKIKKMVTVFLPYTVYILIIPTLVLSMSMVENKYLNAENTNLARLTNSPVSGKWQNKYVFPFTYNTVNMYMYYSYTRLFFRFG